MKLKLNLNGIWYKSKINLNWIKAKTELQTKTETEQIGTFKSFLAKFDEDNMGPVADINGGKIGIICCLSRSQTLSTWYFWNWFGGIEGKRSGNKMLPGFLQS